jgi:hypothetical protein
MRIMKKMLREKKKENEEERNEEKRYNLLRMVPHGLCIFSHLTDFET